MNVRLYALCFSGLALSGCARHARALRTGLDVPSPPPIVAPQPSQDSRRRVDEKMKALAERLRSREPDRTSASSSEPVGALGTVDQTPPAPAPTVGVVVTTPPRARRTPAERESETPPEEEPPRRNIAISVMVAAGLIGAIKFLPRLIAR